MKKLIPALTAIVLIIVIAGIALGGQLYKKYSYSDERADLAEYFHTNKAEDVAILLQDEMIEEKAVLTEGRYYFDLDTVQKYLNSRFYWDQNENLLLYTTPTQVIRAAVGESTYLTDEEAADAGYVISYLVPGDGGEQKAVLYVAADFVGQYTRYSYEAFTDPNRMQIYTQWSQRQVASIKKDTAVRLRGGVKSPILKDVPVGTKVVILEAMETWTKVKTLDGYIGYVENKRLSDITEETPVPETDYVAPEYTSLTRDHKISLGWHVIGGAGGNDTLEEVISATKGLNVISPTWFKLSDNDGNFTSFADASYVKRAHDRGLEVWGLVDNFSNPIDSYTVLSSTTSRNRLVQGLLGAALDAGLDGINVDFEGLGAESGPHFAQFLRELSVVCRNNGLVLSVDNYVPFNFNDFYDREEQGVVADYVIIMGYDEHWHGSTDVGSVSSIGYVRNGIEKMIEEVPSRKIINALPLYSILWKTTGPDVTDDYVIMANESSLVAKLGMETVWDEETCQNYGEVVSGDTTYQLWLEDLDSIQVKLNVMRNYDLAGVAVWRLGYEDPAVWDSISAYTAE